jgi:2-desacetyl-2-hydroxyethyl bacteriochlorophyllide A dehydrogenase
MNAAVFKNTKLMELQDLAIPVIKPEEVLIKVTASGVCKTDFHIFNGESPSKPPVVLGHEYCGEIVDVGKHVNSFSIGEKVAINPNIHCGYCEYCKAGKINLCENLVALGVTRNGGFEEYSAVPISQVYHLPDDVNFYQAAFAEPLSCCIHGLNLAEIELNDVVAIIGAGPIGLLMLQLVKLKGPKEIIIIEPVAEKRELAKQLGATLTLNPMEKDFTDKCFEMCNGGVDVVIECVGNAPAVETAFNISKKGGRIIIFGLSDATSKVSFHLQKFFHKELTVKSSLLNPFTFQTAVDLLVTGKIDTSLFTIEKIKLNQDGLTNLFYKKRDDSIMKYMFEP